MAYNILALKDLAELKTRRGTSANNSMATIMGPNFPTTQAYSVYVWNDSDVSTPDDDNVVQPTVGSPIGRWLKVPLDTSAVNLSVFYTKLDLSTAGNATVVSENVTGLSTVATTGSYTDLSNKPTIPAAQIQSDWNQTTTSSLDYIKK